MTYEPVEAGYDSTAAVLLFERVPSEAALYHLSRTLDLLLPARRRRDILRFRRALPGTLIAGRLQMRRSLGNWGRNKSSAKSYAKAERMVNVMRRATSGREAAKA